MQYKKIFYWASDFSLTSGEGRLARLFIKHHNKKKNIYSKISLPKLKLLNYKYVSPLVGIIYGWVYFFRKKNFLYINYLPLWNFIIFLLLPPKSLIGPITGGAKFSKYSDDYFIRKFIFPILYFLSNLILKFRFDDLVFSTELLRNKLLFSIKKKSKFNFVFYAIKKRKINKKKNQLIDFLIYYRKHKNKKYLFLDDFIKKLINNKYSIHIIGDRLNINGVKNHGTITNKKVLKLLENTKYSIVSNENLYSFFTIDCINNGVKILVNYKIFNSIKYFKKNFIKYNFNSKKINF